MSETETLSHITTGEIKPQKRRETGKERETELRTQNFITQGLKL